MDIKDDKSFIFSRMAQATQVALSAPRPLLAFDPLQRLIAHLEVDSGGFYQN